MPERMIGLYGARTTVVLGLPLMAGEAIHLGRDGLGIEYEDRWADLAAANVAHARRNGATGTAR